MTDSSKPRIAGRAKPVTRLVQANPRPFMMEQRFMFDGAAVADAADHSRTGSRV
jgi:hypothetical protein